jgi:hypothetical protein
MSMTALGDGVHEQVFPRLRRPGGRGSVFESSVEPALALSEGRFGDAAVGWLGEEWTRLVDRGGVLGGCSIRTTDGDNGKARDGGVAQQASSSGSSAVRSSLVTPGSDEERRLATSDGGGGRR